MADFPPGHGIHIGTRVGSVWIFECKCGYRIENADREWVARTVIAHAATTTAEQRMRGNANG